jgi:hypothetical protein
MLLSLKISILYCNVKRMLNLRVGGNAMPRPKKTETVSEDAPLSVAAEKKALAAEKRQLAKDQKALEASRTELAAIQSQIEQDRAELVVLWQEYEVAEKTTLDKVRKLKAKLEKAEKKLKKAKKKNK